MSSAPATQSTLASSPPIAPQPLEMGSTISASTENSTGTEGSSRLWKKFKELNSLAWPSALAIAVAVLHYLGFVAAQGRRAALGMQFLALPTLSQEHVIAGVKLASKLGLQVLEVVLLGFALRAAAKASFHRSQNLQQSLLVASKHQALPWLASIASYVLMDRLVLLTRTLTGIADGIVLKPIAQIALTSSATANNAEQTWGENYLSLLSFGTVVFALTAWWLVTTGIRSRVLQLLY